MNKLVLIDGHALLFRAYYAYPPLTTSEGELVGAVYGFTSILLNTIKLLDPTHIAVSFDLGEPTFRHKEFKAYKANRDETPPDLIVQEARLRQIVTALNIPVYEKAGFEADDVIGTMAEQATKRQVTLTRGSGQAHNKKQDKTDVIIVTGDMDALQLVDDDAPGGSVHVFVPGRNRKPDTIYDEAHVEDKYQGLQPEQIIDYKGLAGDPSDNIPGVKGIGPKTAITLLLKFSSIEGVYNVIDGNAISGIVSNSMIDKLRVGKESAFLSKKLATIVRDAPVKLNLADCMLHSYDKDRVLTLFKELNFKSLISKLPKDEFEQSVQEALF